MAFELEMAHGLCVGVRIPADIDELPAEELSWLQAEEQRYAGSLRKLRQLTWVAGRVAMRRALDQLGVRAAPVLPNDRGAPILPGGVVGSISHKRALAVAMVADSAGGTLGVDIEERRPPRSDIAKRVLTPDELDELAALPAADRGQAVVLRFSLKESVYKAIDPFVRRYVGFQEVSLMVSDAASRPPGSGLRGDLGERGAAQVTPRFASDPPLHIEAEWRVHSGYFLTSARARRAK